MFNWFCKIKFLVLLSIFFALSIVPCFASYEIIEARTVQNENLNDKKEIPVPTFNDIEPVTEYPEDYISTKLENKIKAFRKKRLNKKHKQDTDIIQEEPILSEQNITSGNMQDTDKTTENIQEKNKFQINADKMSYDDSTGSIYADGHVEISAKTQGVVIKSDHAVFERNSQTIKLRDNVKIIKDGTEMKGEYLVIDLNEQNILIDSPVIEAFSFKINAQEGYLIANDLQMLNGNITNEKETEYPLLSQGFMSYSYDVNNYIDKKNDYSALDKTNIKKNYTINAKDVEFISYKDHYSFLFKKADIYYDKHKIIRNKDIEILSDKKKECIEVNTPEIGTFQGFGTFVGYGFVSRLPKKQMIKLMPVLSLNDSKLGIGILGRLRSRNHLLEAGWNSSTSDNFVFRGKYKFSDSLSFRYSRWAYIPQGFLGTARPGYGAEFQYDKSYRINDLGGATFGNTIYAGFFSDYNKENQEKNAYATTRWRYMAELNKPLLTYHNKEQDLSITIAGGTQASATLYGSGQTAGVVRIGPSISSKLKNWESSIGYYFGGIYGTSPFMFDLYRYGKSTITINEKYDFGDKLSLGFRVYISPLRDNYEEDLLTETRIYAILGPKDLKLALSYDLVREMGFVDFLFLIGSKSSKINFEHLITKNADNSKNSNKDFYKRNKTNKQENI